MKNISLLRKSLFMLLSLCLVISGAFLLTNSKKASAFSIGTFEMDSGAYVKVNDGGGLRMRVKMDNTTKAEVEKADNTLFFLLMTEDMFKAAETETSGEYDFSDYLSYTNFNTQGCTRLDSDVSKIYSYGGYYYSNLLIYNIPDEYRTINLCVVAGITDGEDTETAAFDTPSQVCKIYYNVLNASALAGFMDRVNNISDYNTWYGSSDYPVYIETNSQYSYLKSAVNDDDVDMSAKFVDFGDDVVRDASFDAASFDSDKIAEEVDVSFDFDLSLSSSQGAKITQLDKDLTPDDINRVTDLNSKSIAFTKDTENSELDFTSETINTLSIGDNVVRISTDDKLYKAKFTVATEIITTWARLKAITQSSAADAYYVLGADIIATDSVAGNRTGTFAGTLDGKGHIVSGITITGTAWTGHAFIQYLSGTIKNIALVDITTQYKANSYDSALLCKEIQAGAILDNVYLSGTVCSGYASKKTNGIFNARTGVFTIKNCIVKVENAPENVATTSYAIGANSTWATANMVNNCYVISSFENLFQSASSNVVQDTVRYDDASDFFGSVTAFDSADGWSKYWRITEDGLDSVIADTPASDLDITSSFSFARVSAVYGSKAGGTIGKRNVNAALTSFVSTNGFVDISAYQGKTLLINMPQSAYYGLAFYTTNAEPTTDVPAISGVVNSSAATDTITTVEIAIPANANYIRTTYYSSTEGTDARKAAALAKPFKAIIVEGTPSISGVRLVLAKPAE